MEILSQIPFLNNIIGFILNPSGDFYLTAKFIFLSVILFFIGIIIFVLVTTTWLNRMIIWDIKEYLTYRHFGVSKIDNKWARIKERLGMGTESEAKLAVIEAETVLNEVLKNMGFSGDSFGERLSQLTTDIISCLAEVKEVHKIRSHIVHDPSYRMDLKEAKKILDVYEEALVELQAL